MISHGDFSFELVWLFPCVKEIYVDFPFCAFMISLLKIFLKTGLKLMGVLCVTRGKYLPIKGPSPCFLG